MYRRIVLKGIAILLALSPAMAQTALLSSHPQEKDPKVFEMRLAGPSPQAESQTRAAAPPESPAPVQYGGFADFGYLLDFNHPSNQLFRSRGTTWHVDDPYLNMAGAYVRRKATETSPWGAELFVHSGKDDEIFGFSATAPNMPGHKWLRHLGPANLSYVAPVGRGLTVQGGIFSSLIGYDSLYAKDNFNYTRPWCADFTPYLMLGLNASYPFSDRFTGTFLLLNGYWHLADANHVPTIGGQAVYRFTPQVTLKETVIWGPHQADTSVEYWRVLSDTIIERKTESVTFAFEYHAATEVVAAPGKARANWMAAQLPVRWHIRGPWSVSVRPEVAWDSDGRWTLARQTVKAITTTLEYRIPYRWASTIVRLEHRFDDSRGPEGGFFSGAALPSGALPLTPRQHLIVFGLIFTFDSP